MRMLIRATTLAVTRSTAGETAVYLSEPGPTGRAISVEHSNHSRRQWRLCELVSNKGLLGAVGIGDTRKFEPRCHLFFALNLDTQPSLGPGKILDRQRCHFAQRDIDNPTFHRDDQRLKPQALSNRITCSSIETKNKCVFSIRDELSLSVVEGTDEVKGFRHRLGLSDDTPNPNTAENHDENQTTERFFYHFFPKSGGPQADFIYVEVLIELLLHRMNDACLQHIALTSRNISRFADRSFDDVAR